MARFRRHCHIGRIIQSYRPDYHPSFQKTPAYPITDESEKKIRKYYPKRSSKDFLGYFFFPHQSLENQKAFERNSRALITSKRNFFKSLCVNLGYKTAKIPQSIEQLSVFNGSPLILKKIIPQNKKTSIH